MGNDDVNVIFDGCYCVFREYKIDLQEGVCGETYKGQELFGGKLFKSKIALDLGVILWMEGT